MTVSATTAKNQYTGTGSLQVFAYTFRILDEDDIQVDIEDVNGTITTQTITTHYTVSGVGSASGGNITFVSAPAATDTIILTRNVPLSQAIDYVENDPFPASSHENALDKLTMIAQQIDEASSRGVKVPVTSTISDVTLPVVANGYLRWNSSATSLTAVVLTDTGALTQVVEDSTPQLGGDLDTNGNAIQFDDATGIEDDSGNEQLIFQKTTSAVNHIEITNAATGNSPTVSAAGDDTNIDLTLSGKGSGNVSTGTSDLEMGDGNGIVDENGNEQLLFNTTASAVNQLEITNAATGNSPTLSATGGDANVSLSIQPKGAGTVNILGTADTAASLALAEDTDNGTNTVSVSAPSSISSSLTFTLPSTDGSNGDYITTNGSGQLAFTTPTGSGSWVLLSTATASDDASVTFTSSIDGTYDTYAFVWTNLVPASDARLIFQVSVNGGSSYLATGYTTQFVSSSASANSIDDDIADGIPCHSNDSGHYVDAGVTAAGSSGILYLGSPSNGSVYSLCHGASTCLANTGSNAVFCQFGGFYAGATTAINAAQFIMDTGNISTGEFYMYGIVTS